MMQKIYLAAIFLLLHLSQKSLGQAPEKNLTEITADTIESITTDTSIVYIIKKAPVKIKETIQVKLAKQKRLIYLSLYFSAFTYSEKYKAQNGYDTFTKALNSATKPQNGYTFGGDIWQAPKKISTKITASISRTYQQFNYQDASGQNYTSLNKFVYSSLGYSIGYWYKKNKKTSLMIHGGPILKYHISSIGYTLDKNDFKQTARLNRVVQYNKFSLGFTGSINFLIDFKNTILEVGPYLIIAPFSSTTKSEAYRATQNILGIRIALTNRLFNQ